MLRAPAVAGSFYPDHPQRLREQVGRLVPAGISARPARALIAPHAGYVYSGAVAGELFARTEIPQTVVLLGPNHHGCGATVAASAAQGWQTPLGTVQLNAALRDEMCRQIETLQLDDSAHQYEHSLEVMLPLLLQRQPALQIVPIALRSLSLDHCLQLAQDLARVLRVWPDEVLLLASSDMNHFLDAQQTERLDQLAIAAMTAYEPRELYRTVVENRISMCGMLPAVVVLEAARLLGATNCELVRYAHSGQVNGDNSRVVGYAALAVT